MRKITLSDLRAWAGMLLMLVFAFAALRTQVVRAATIPVTNTNNSGPGSLRQAILDANANPGADTITFDTAGVFATPQTITLSSTLIIADAAGLTIDGAGQSITISGNNAVTVMFVDNGAALTIKNLTIANGNGGGDGGGIYNFYGSLTIENSTFTGNTASLYGGAIYSIHLLTIRNSTFSGNSAAHGGAITAVGAFGQNSTATISNSTFAGNTSSDFGDSIFIYASIPLTLKNTILVHNTSNPNCFVETGSIIDGGGNLSYPDSTCPGVHTDALLGPLQLNAPGKTATHALLAGSPAIDTGVGANCLPTDQRGVTRPQGPQCDIGAFELQQLTPTPIPTDTPTETPFYTPIPTDTATETPFFTPFPTDTPTETPFFTLIPTDTATETPFFTPIPTDTATETPFFTAIPTDTATETPFFTLIPTDTATETPFFTPIPTDTATETPFYTNTPTNTPGFTNIPPTIVVAAGGICGSSGGTMNLSLADPNGLGGLTLSGRSSNTSVVPNSNILFGGSGANRTVTITAVAASTVRTAVVTVTVSDGSASASLIITVLVGTNGNNSALNGTSGADLILGLDGKDTLSGLNGTDLLCGGAQDDTLYGDSGEDTLNGNNGNDTLVGSSGNDRLSGENGNDNLLGGSGHDSLNGGAGNDSLKGESGNDLLTGGANADFFSGGPGNDVNTDFDTGQGDTRDET